ncbi:chitosanase [Ilyomonas limi]|uniref:Chitosanase n=2 Tax=Ilyomonas limi TaxID=2575867 RepID=A0A4U3L317_9BACT|nr:chitosanase [Ilyomonas limi]
MLETIEDHSAEVSSPTENAIPETSTATSEPDSSVLPQTSITPAIKNKIQQVVNAFETGSAQGNYSGLVKYDDYTDPVTKTRSVQVTYGRSQTTEFGNLKALIQAYVGANGLYAAQLKPYVNRIGTKPSLANDATFCQALIDAGKKDPIMRTCQDTFFDKVYYQPAGNWFVTNGFTMPLSMLVIYDSYVHSGCILPFLRRKFVTAVPAAGGNEKEWINNYVEVRQSWLASHSNPVLRKTIYRTHCFQEQMMRSNWDLSKPISANGITIA